MPLNTSKYILIALIAVIIIGACGYYYYTTTLPKKITLKLHLRAGVWVDHVTKSGVLKKFHDRMLKEKNLDVKVEIVTSPFEGYSSKLISALAAGEAGDVIWLPNKLITDVVEAGYIIDLTSYLEKWPSWDKVYKPAKEEVTYKGKFWNTPYEYNCRTIIYYRKDLLKKAGIPIPWQPKTLDDLIKTTLTIKEKIPEIKVPILPRWYEEHVVYAFGGRIYDPAENKWVVKSDAILNCFKYYYDLFYTYKVCPREAILEKWDKRELFRRGEEAILVDGIWAWGEMFGPGKAYEIPNREEIVGYAYFPGSGKPGTPKFVNIAAGGAGYAITSACKNPDLAWELIKDLVAPEICSTWCISTSHPVARADCAIGEYAKDPFMMWATAYVKDYGVARPQVYGISKYRNDFKKAMSELIGTGISPEEAMEKFASMVSKDVGAENVKEE